MQTSGLCAGRGRAGTARLSGSCPTEGRTSAEKTPGCRQRGCVPSGSPMRTCDMGGGGGGGAGVLRGGMRMAEMDREFLSFADQVRRGRCPPHLYGCSISFLQLGHRSGMDSGYQSWLVSFYDFSAMEVPSHLRGHVGHPQPMCGIFTSHSKVGSRKPSFGSQREITTLPVKPVANKKCH